MTFRASGSLGICNSALRFQLLLAMVMAPALGLADGPSRLFAAENTLRVAPGAMRLDGPESSQQVVVWSKEAPLGREIDATRKSELEIANPAIARVDRMGLIRPVTDGKTELIVKRAGATVRLPLEVVGVLQPRPISFQYDIMPALTKSRCNSGGCHGKAEGQAGFKLSIFGFDPDADLISLRKEGRGRRLSISNPADSLLIRKGTAETPHGGGRKLDRGSVSYRRLVRWIGEGAEGVDDPTRVVTSLEVFPLQKVMSAGESLQLRADATETGGRKQCVTATAEYESNNTAVAVVNADGLIEATGVPGEAAVLVRYMGHVTVCRVTIPRSTEKFPRPPENNFVDKLVWDHLEQLGVPPSELCDDSTFIRRVYLDVIGVLPTVAEVRSFLKDPAADKRAKLIDRLLERPEYAEYWAMKWSNLLRADRNKIGTQGTVAVTRWLQKRIQENVPYDEFVREILTAQGSPKSEGPTSFFFVLDSPELAGRSVSQLFLGVRIECAQCHHHPSERWGQDDYAGFAGFFTGVSRRKTAAGLDAIVSRGGTDVKHPRTGELVPARALGAPSADFSGISDRRVVLARWMTERGNPFFARAISNRLWAQYFGRGLVEPIDDMRITNPASNEPLLQALSLHLKDAKFDLKVLTRTILNSRVYQLTARPNERNREDVQNFSHAMPKALPAEVLLDGISQTTGAAEKFVGWPLGARAVQVWDNRMPSYFLKIFGRPVRATVCECERSNEPSISQALHLLNSPEIQTKIQARGGTVRTLADSTRTPSEIIDELYLAALSRFPTDAERKVMLETFAIPGQTRRTATEDILWAILNSKEFIYNH